MIVLINCTTSKIENMFSFFQNIKSSEEPIITLDTVNKKLQDKRRQTLVLACMSLFFLGNRYLIDGAINLLVNNKILNSQLSLGIYLCVGMSALYFIFGLLQETSSLISQREEINDVLMDC